MSFDKEAVKESVVESVSDGDSSADVSKILTVADFDMAVDIRGGPSEAERAARIRIMYRDTEIKSIDVLIDVNRDEIIDITSY